MLNTAEGRNKDVKLDQLRGYRIVIMSILNAQYCGGKEQGRQVGSIEGLEDRHHEYSECSILRREETRTSSWV